MTGVVAEFGSFALWFYSGCELAPVLVADSCSPFSLFASFYSLLFCARLISWTCVKRLTLFFINRLFKST